MIENFIENLEIGIVLMLIGMGFVFAFLYIMVLVMRVMSKTVIWMNKFFPEEVPADERQNKRANISQDEAIAVAIAVAKARG